MLISGPVAPLARGQLPNYEARWQAKHMMRRAMRTCVNNEIVKGEV